jgi:hypothetical protein
VSHQHHHLTRTHTHTHTLITHPSDIPARYLLRLGMGERDLDVDDDFSRAGRVNNMLARRLTLLAEVRARSLSPRPSQSAVVQCGKGSGACALTRSVTRSNSTCTCTSAFVRTPLTSDGHT